MIRCGLLLLVASAGAGCIELGVYRCEGAEACGEGTCEPTGYCSYADGECPSGRRYSELAGDDLARTCVAQGSDTLASSSDTQGSESGDTEEMPGQVQWSATIAGVDGFRDIAWGVVVLGSGDVVVGGLEGTDADANDLLLARFAGGDGAEQWVFRRDGGAAMDDEIHDVAIDATGRIIAGGFETTVDGGMQAWVGAFDGNGVPTFEHHPTGWAVEAVVGNSGGFIVAGGANGDEADGFVASYWEGGSGPQWTARSAAAGDDFYTAIARVADDEVIVAGVHDGDITLGHAAAGTVTELATIDGEQMLYDDVQGLALHRPSGDVVAAGYQTTAFAHDAWLGRYTTAGSPVFTVLDRAVDLEVDEEFEDVVVDGEGDIVAVGFRVGDDRDAWVRKFDAAGVLLWSREFADVGDSIARSVDVDGEGDIALAGEVVGPDGSRDIWVAKLAKD